MRPYAKELLESLSKMFELHICTFGARLYAHTIASFLDPKSKHFSHRILSRDECFDSRSKTANLSSLFPCGDHMVCIIDDRKDVWNFAPNLVHIKPYVFFKDTGDINDPAKFNKAANPSNEDAKEEVKEKKEEEKVEKEKPKAEKNMEILCESEEKDKEESSQVSPPIEAKEGKRDIDEVSDDLELSDDDDESDVDETGKDGDKDEDGSTASSMEDDLEEVEDTDDYLHHLEDILKTIHKAYYELYDQVLEQKKKLNKGGNGDDVNVDSKFLPDLKTVIPYVRRKTLSGVSIVLSGVDPMNVPPDKSKARAVARSLGAAVTEGIIPGETVFILIVIVLISNSC